MQHNNHICVCALVPYPLDTAPSQRFRIEQWAPFLKAQGIEIELIPFVDNASMQLLHQPGQQAAKALALASAFARRIADVATARRYDAVFIHRAACIAGPALLERLLAVLRCPVIFDFDDAIFMLHTTAANRQFGWLKFPGKTAAICGLSTHIVAGNSFLADYARQFNPRVTVIPTSVDTARYQPVKKNESRSRVVIGWSGSSTSQTHLEMFAPLLRQALSRPDVELRVISNREPSLPGISYVWRPWSAETETEELSNFDIGIMPMPDDKWARGKCALKALQYMAMGVPTVCSAVGANCEVIEDGKNGMLVDASEDWNRPIAMLVDDPLLRAMLGEAGRRTVEERYSMDRCAGMFADVVREVTGRRGVLKKPERIYQPVNAD